MLPKHDLVFHIAPIAVETDHSAFTVQLSTTKPAQDLSHINRPSVPIIEYWVSDSEDESETTAPQNVPSFVQSSKQVKTPRHFVQPTETSIATPKPSSLKFYRSGKRKNRKTCFMCKSVDHLIKHCDHHTKKMAQPTPRNYAHRDNNKQNASLTHKHPPKHMVLLQFSLSLSQYLLLLLDHPSPKTSNSPTRVTAAQALVVITAQGNMSYLSDFKELNGGYVAFGSNPKGGKIYGKEKIKT
nr:hypothetical protein [Tanacetum cinerariifolium]